MGHDTDLDIMLGEPKKAIFRMALPLIVSFAVVQVNSFADTAWCSGLGAEVNSGLTSISPFYWIVAGLGSGMGVGASTAIARHLAKGQNADANRTAVHAVVMVIAIALVITPLLVLPIHPIMDLIGAGDVADHAYSYMMPMMSMAVFIVLSETLSGIVRSEGAARRSMLMMLSAATLNMVLDPVLIYGLDMGATGAGLATALSSMLACIIGLQWYARGRMTVSLSPRGFHPDKRTTMNILGVGVPRATETMMINGMSLVERYFVIICAGSFGSALFSIPWNFVTLCCIVSMALAAAMIPVCSAALGINDPVKAREGFLYGTKLCLILMVTVDVAIFVFADACVTPFTMSESMLAHKSEFVEVLRIYCLFIPFVGMIDMGSSLLQCLRKANVSMWSSLLRNMIIVVLFAITCHTTLDMMFMGLAAAEVAGGIMMMTLAAYVFKVKTGVSLRRTSDRLHGNV